MHVKTQIGNGQAINIAFDNTNPAFRAVPATPTQILWAYLYIPSALR